MEKQVNYDTKTLKFHTHNQFVFKLKKNLFNVIIFVGGGGGTVTLIMLLF